MIIQFNFPATDFADLPVLSVSANSVEARRKSIKQIRRALELRSLSSTCIRQKESGHQHRYGVLSLIQQYDLVIIDAENDDPALQCKPGAASESIPGVQLLSGSDDEAMKQFVDRLVMWMNTLVQQTPVWGCILIGGKSSRMGQPKHLIEDQQKITWLERTVAILAPLVDGIVVSGNGRLPERLAETTRLADVPGVSGPLTGIVAACRWQPMVSWLLVACDMPNIATEAIQWLLSDRHAGCWGRVPKLAESKRAEPLLAWYDFRAGQIFEELVYNRNLRIGDAAVHPKIDTPLIPEALHQSWQNINTPDQLPASPA